MGVGQGGPSSPTILGEEGFLDGIYDGAQDLQRKEGVVVGRGRGQDEELGGWRRGCGLEVLVVTPASWLGS